MYAHALYYIVVYGLPGSTLSPKRYDWGKKLSHIKCILRFSIQLSFETFLILRRIQRAVLICIGLQLKNPLFLADFNGSWILSIEFRKNTLIPNFMKIRPVGAEMFHEGGRTDRQTWRNYCTQNRNTSLRFRSRGTDWKWMHNTKAHCIYRIPSSYDRKYIDETSSQLVSSGTRAESASGLLENSKLAQYA